MEPIVVGKVTVPASAITQRAVRSSGPGGQNVNKVSSKVELRVDLAAIEGIGPGARARLDQLAKNRVDATGALVMTSERTRDRLRNLADAIEKIRELIAQALVEPKPRKKTKPSRGAVERRLAGKQRDARIKAARRARDD